MVRSETREAGAGLGPPPGGTGALEPWRRHDAPGTGRARGSERCELRCAKTAEPSQPVEEGAGRGQPGLEQPPVLRGPGHHDARGRVGSRARGQRDRDVGGGAPADHRPRLAGTGAEHLARAVPGADHDRRALGHTEARRHPGEDGADDLVGGHDGRQFAGELGARHQRDRVGRVEAGPRGHGDVGRHPTGEAPSDDIPRSEDPSGRGELLGTVRRDPGQLRHHRTGVERAARSASRRRARGRRDRRAPPPRRPPGGRTTGCPAGGPAPRRRTARTSGGRRSARPPPQTRAHRRAPCRDGRTRRPPSATTGPRPARRGGGRGARSRAAPRPSRPSRPPPRPPPW